jgi:hypothetical protein
MHRIDSLGPTTPEYLPVKDTSGLVFPNDYVNHLVRNYSHIVGASANQFNPKVSEPVREMVVGVFPQLKSAQVNTLVGDFLTRIRNERKRVSSRAGVLPLATQHKKRQGGKNY